MITNASNLISNMNDDFYEDFFEVYNIFLGQKLMILEFMPKKIIGKRDAKPDITLTVNLVYGLRQK